MDRAAGETCSFLSHLEMISIIIKREAQPTNTYEESNSFTQKHRCSGTTGQKECLGGWTKKAGEILII